MKTISCIVPNSNFIRTILEKYKPKDVELLFPKLSNQNIKDIECLIVFLSSLSIKDIEGYRKLKFIQLLSAGFDNIDSEAIKRKGIKIADNNGTNATAVAEHTILLILALLKKINTLQENTLSGKWQSSPPISALIELEGKTVGIIGLGRIGQKVAKRLLSFGAKINYFDIRRIPKSEFSDSQVKSVTLKEIFHSSDIISLHTPLSKESFHLINNQTIKKMKNGVFIINTSRGAVVDQKAVISALKKSKLDGIGFDVFEKEPLENNPYQGYNNVILTPHRAGSTLENWHARVKFAFENIERFRRGQTPWALV